MIKQFGCLGAVVRTMDLYDAFVACELLKRTTETDPNEIASSLQYIYNV